MQRLSHLSLLATLIFFISVRALAWPPTYGLELTLANDWLLTASYEDNFTIDHPEAETHQELLARRIAQSCKGCTVKKSKDKYGATSYRVEFPDAPVKNWGFEITLDPGCIEIITKPATYEEFVQLRPLIEENIFKAAERAYLKPMVEVGGGHINIGFDSAFSGRPELFANVLADYAKHSEIGAGVFGNDFFNAPPIRALQLDRQRKFARILQEFRTQLATQTRDGKAIALMTELATRINNEVYFGPGLAGMQGGGSEPKWHALNLTSIEAADVPLKNKRLELRSFDTHTSAEEVYAALELTDRRLHLLSSSKKIISFEPGPLPGPKQRMLDFADYVRESGMELSQFSSRIVEKAWRRYYGAAECGDLLALKQSNGLRTQSTYDRNRTAHLRRNSRNRFYD